MNKEVNEKKNDIRPVSVPKKSLGRKLSVKVAIRKDYVRQSDGKSQLYINISYGGKRKKLYLNIYVKPKLFSSKKQRVSKTDSNSNDINMLIEKKISELHAIELEYRLRGSFLSIEQLVKDFENPTKNIDFFTFYEKELEKDRYLLKPNTYRQQKSSLKLLREFSQHVYFSQINDDLIKEIIVFFKKRGNKISTINVHLKNLKKYLHRANDKNILTELKYSDITITRVESETVFLTKDELRRLFDFYKSNFITSKQKGVLQRFLFSCFTGLRISDVQKLTNKNISDNVILLTTTKTEKIQQIRINETAKKFINLGQKELFNGKYANQTINAVLKEIAKQTSIKKRITFHVARHTFATQWLLNGGRIVQLQKTLGHSQIKDTMIYSHIADSLTDPQILLLDNILSLD